MQSHICRVHTCVCSCNMPPALWAECSGSFTCYCGNTDSPCLPFSKCSGRQTSKRKTWLSFTFALLEESRSFEPVFSHRPLVYQCVSRTEEPVNITFKTRLKKLHHFCCRHCSYKKGRNSLQHVTLGMPNTALTWPLIDERQSAVERYILKDLSFSKHVQYVEEIKVQHDIKIFSNSHFSSNKWNKRS